jgi:twitching motility protein PilT
MIEIRAEDIFKRAVGEGCSDVHIKPGSPPKMRKNGKLFAIPSYESFILDAETTSRLTQETMDEHAFAQYGNPDAKQLDYSYEIPQVGRFRMNVYRTRGADAFVGRLLQNKPKTLDELGVSSGVKKLAKSKNGLIIVSGATGSGKSTTMAGIIDYINNSQPVNIISIEDPIEVVHSDAMASIAQREVGVDVDSYELALTAALREDPDVILIGEIRTKETLKTAILAADTGHLVVATLHTTDASKAINRIIALSISEERDLVRQQLAAVLRGIVAQRLVPNINGGRTVVNEILVNTPEIAQIIIDEGSEQEFHDILERSPSMLSFERCFVERIEQGVIDLKTARDYSNSEYYDNIKIKEPVNRNTKNIVEAPEAKNLPPIPGMSHGNSKAPLHNKPPLPTRPAQLKGKSPTQLLS